MKTKYVRMKEELDKINNEGDHVNDLKHKFRNSKSISFKQKPLLMPQKSFTSASKFKEDEIFGIPLYLKH